MPWSCQSCRRLCRRDWHSLERREKCGQIQGGTLVAGGWVATWRWPMWWLVHKLNLDLNSTARCRDLGVDGSTTFHYSHDRQSDSLIKKILALMFQNANTFCAGFQT